MNRLYFERRSGEDYWRFDRDPGMKGLDAKAEACESCYYLLSEQTPKKLIAPRRGKVLIAVPDVARVCWKYYIGSHEAEAADLLELLGAGEDSFAPGHYVCGKISGCPDVPHGADIVVYGKSLMLTEPLRAWAASRQLDLAVSNGCPEVFSPLLGFAHVGELPPEIEADESRVLDMLKVVCPTVGDALDLSLGRMTE
ncbi:MAG: hypothetical protein FJY76_00355 [Candidatus Aenigmarchaeota archaeon]|nr:hypothetical protein [Candidatus Aenigmarchaeota archaeon]